MTFLRPRDPPRREAFVSEPLLELAMLVQRETGIVIEDNQLGRLQAVADSVAPEMSTAELVTELDDSASGRQLLGGLIDEVTVQQTYFFRESYELRSVDWRLLMEAARTRGEAVRVWVPGCASGEDAYTLAMLAIEASDTRQTPVTILGTDVASTAIESALAGAYSARSVRKVPSALRERYFETSGMTHLLREPVKSMVGFRGHNLVTDPSPPPGEAPFDVIACRNVLIYFDNETVRRVVASLEAALRPGGELILGAADRLTGTTARLAGAPVKVGYDRRSSRASGRKLRRPLGLPEADTGSEASAEELGTPLTDPQAPSAAGDLSRRRVGDRVAEAMWAADAGDFDRTIEITTEVLDADPLNADAFFARGVAELGLEDANAAVTSLRRSLYTDPFFGLAAFELGRAHEAAGNPDAAQRSYERALRTLDPADGRHRAIIDQVEMGEVAAACRLRLASRATAKRSV
jgi:chemotaxis protein methyltransferase CheR